MPGPFKSGSGLMQEEQMTTTMKRWIEMSVSFAGEGEARRPAAVSMKRPSSGTRVTVRLDADCLSSAAVYLLSRIGTNIVVMGSAKREQVEAARQALGAAIDAYQVVEVKVLDFA
jgi:hypothetical protein